MPFSAAAKQLGFPNARYRVWEALGKPRPQPNAFISNHRTQTAPSSCHLSSGRGRLNRARKSRFCLKTHIFSKNSGQPQEGVNPLPSSGTTAAPHATSPSSSPQMSDQAFSASCTTLLVTPRKCASSTCGKAARATVCESSPSNRTNLMPWFIAPRARKRHANSSDRSYWTYV